MKDKLAPHLVQGVFIGLLESKKAYIIHDVVFYKGGRVGPSKVHVTISNTEESNEEIDVTVNAGPDLKAS